MNQVLDDTSFTHIALDTNPLNVEIKREAKETRTKPFVFTFFRQIDVWGIYILRQVDTYPTGIDKK